MLVVVSVLWSLQRRMIYFPDPAAPASPPAGVREVELTTSDGLRLAAWLAAPTGADARIAVLVAPGNAGNRRDRLPLAAALAGEGLSVLLLDYRGYGGNPGSPSEAGLARDVRAGWAYLTGPASFPAGRVVLFGESLGAAVVAELATEVAPAGLVLRSPFESLAAVGREHYPLLPVRCCCATGSRWPSTSVAPPRPRRSSTARPTASCRPRTAAPCSPGRPTQFGRWPSRARTTTTSR